VTPPRVTREDVGSLWVRDDGRVWRLIMYSDGPDVTWEAVDGPPKPREYHRDRIGGAVGSPITDGFHRLVREDL
jgi:hypothetical protein